MELNGYKLAEAELRRSRERLERAEQIAHLGSWELDWSHNRLTWSDEVYRIFGLQPQIFGATYESFLELVHPEDRAAVHAAYTDSVCENSDGYEIEHRVVRKNTGEIRYVHEKCEHIRDTAGRTIRSIGMVHDITDRKRAEQALRQNERRLSLAISATSDAVWEWNLLTQETYFSPRWYEMLGYRDQEISMNYEGWKNLCHPEDLQPTMELIRSRLVSPDDRGYAAEFRMRAKDGSWVWILGKGRVVERNAAGEPVLLSGTNADITERKNTETKQALLMNILQVLNGGGDLHPLMAETLRLLRQATGCDAVGLRLRKGDDWPYFEHNGFSEDFLKEENSLCLRKGDGKIVRDAEGRVVLECTCGLVLSGGTDPGMPFFTQGGSFWTNASSELLALPNESDPRTNPRNRCIHVGYASVGLFPIRSGKEIVGLLQLNDRRANRFTPEMIAFYETLAQNIGLALQRVAAEESLRGNEARLSAILEQLPVGVGVLDHNGRFILSNSALRGYMPRKIMPSQDPQQVNRWSAIDAGGHLLAPDEWPDARALRGETSNPGVEFLYTAENGAAAWIFVSAVPFRSPEDKIMGAIAVFQDITDHKRTQEELLELTATLEQRVTERTELAEARTRQLQSLAVELIEAEERERRRVAQLLHDDLQQLLASARMQLEVAIEDLPFSPMLAQVGHLIKESVEKSRRLSHELSPAVLYHSGLVAGLQWLARQMKDQFGMEVHLEMSATQPFENTPFKVFMFRAVQELLFNVVKHAGVKRAHVHLFSSTGHLGITVSDQGQGFNITLPYASSATAGLGLLSIRERANCIGGSLDIESEVGQGSRFTLLFPVSQAETPKSQWPETAVDPGGRVRHGHDCRPASGGIRVLFADDHHIMRKGLIRLISGQPDIQVVGEAANGREALDLARQLRPDVIVMDVAMPQMDGVESTRLIKADLPDVRVIGLSMSEDKQVRRIMRDAGAEDFLTKTASAAELLKAIYGINSKLEG